MADSGCEVVVCEAHCVAGSVIRPVDASLSPSEVCGHTAGPVWPTTATSPLPLSGWDDSHREREEKTHGGRPSIGCSPDVACLAGWLECAVHTVYE